MTIRNGTTFPGIEKKGPNMAKYSHVDLKGMTTENKKEPFEVYSRLFLQIPDHLTGGGNSNMFWNFHPRNLAKNIIHFDVRIFFIVGLVQPLNH